jgi:hypothetical protein
MGAKPANRAADVGRDEAYTLVVDAWTSVVESMALGDARTLDGTDDVAPVPA